MPFGPSALMTLAVTISPKTGNVCALQHLLDCERAIDRRITPPAGTWTNNRISAVGHLNAIGPHGDFSHNPVWRLKLFFWVIFGGFTAPMQDTRQHRGRYIRVQWLRDCFCECYFCCSVFIGVQPSVLRVENSFSAWSIVSPNKCASRCSGRSRVSISGFTCQQKRGKHFVFFSRFPESSVACPTPLAPCGALRHSEVFTRTESPPRMGHVRICRTPIKK